MPKQIITCKHRGKRVWEDHRRDNNKQQQQRWWWLWLWSQRL